MRVAVSALVDGDVGIVDREFPRFLHRLNTLGLTVQHAAVTDEIAFETRTVVNRQAAANPNDRR